MSTQNTLHWFVLAVVLFVVASPASSAPSTGPCAAYFSGLNYDQQQSCACFQFLSEQYAQVIAMTDIVARNWWITLSYQDIGQAFQVMLNTQPTTQNPNRTVVVWPTMAMWASNVVGFGIRGQMIDEVAAFWKRSAPAWMQELLTLVPEVADLVFQQLLQHTAAALGGGNHIVFEEIGGSYTRYGVTFCSDTAFNATKINAFVETVCAGGACPLAVALRSTYDAQFAPSISDGGGEAGNNADVLKSQRIFVQSMLAGLQEQTRLQPYINASLPGYEFCWNLSSHSSSRVSKMNDKLNIVLLAGGTKKLHQELQTFARRHISILSSRHQSRMPQEGEGSAAEKTRLQSESSSKSSSFCLAPTAFNEMATLFFIHLPIGSHRLPAAYNIPSFLHSGMQNFSYALRNLSQLPLAEITWTQMQLNHTDDATVLDFTAAQDWNNLSQRMKFISAAFRVFQDLPEINCFPFSQQQESIIRRNDTAQLDPDSWKKLCVSDCCARNGQWVQVQGRGNSVSHA